MVKRTIIKIDEEKCNGCGLCIPNCKEGALQIIDGKARLISDIFCDGLGACLGHCPEGAISMEEREAKDFNEEKVKEHLAPKSGCACPGAKMMDFSQEQGQGSQLRQWPIQLHLVPPNAPYFQGKDVVLAADCVAYALGDFHKDHLKGKSLAIACPKLDDGQDIYLQKLVAMIDQAKINTLMVMTMEVPCCGGLLSLANQAAAQARRKIPVKSIVVGLQGGILTVSR
ncbi:MAG: 4Fe-4S binding protein [Candidatus Margulisiibacteriota bacterium]